MANLRWKELFKALFLAGFVAYLIVLVCGVVWVGVPVLVVFAWLFYDLRQKAIIFKRILRRKFWQEIGESSQAKLQKAWKIAVAMKKEMKKFFWDDNRARITTIISPAIICTMLFPLRDKEGAPLLIFLYFLLIVWAFVVFCVAQAGHHSGISDKKIALFLLRLFFWNISPWHNL